MANSFAQVLRSNMTEAEKRLWSLIRNRQLDGHKFRRQHPLGPFVADFVCVERRVIVELDGGQHADSAGDARRTAWLECQGWRVIRFWNNVVLTETDGVLEAISQELARSDPNHAAGTLGLDHDWCAHI